MPPKKDGGDPLVSAITGRHKRDVAVMAAVMGDSPESAGFMLRAGNYFGGYDRGMATATRAVLGKVASGEITQAKAAALIAAADKAVDEG